MYHEFYQLRENPFNVTADPAFFYPSKQHAEAVALLAYGIQQRKGILVLTGEIGTGKTTLCRKILNRENGSNIHFALVLNPNFSGTQLLQTILQDLGIPHPKKTRFDLINALNHFLLEESIKGKNVALILDEAQNMKPQQLEDIRLLSNLETEKEKLLQIILIGQPELNKKLQLPSLRQLRQRISVYYHLDPLGKDDIQAYIQHRLEKAMHTTGSWQSIFTDKAVDRIYHYSMGSPRTINILCDRALMAGFVSGKYDINEDIIENCAKEVLYCEHHS